MTREEMMETLVQAELDGRVPKEMVSVRPLYTMTDEELQERLRDLE